jgi:hypothetical protein
VPLVDLADDTFVVAPAALLAPLCGAPGAPWWPDLTLDTTRDRGVKGRQWAVTGALAGTAEIWLEPLGDGVVVHLYLRADPVGQGQWSPRRVQRERTRRTLAWKRHVHALKDSLEAGRPPGVTPASGHG